MQRQDHNLTVKVTVEVYRNTESDPLLVTGHRIVKPIPAHTEDGGWGFGIPREDRRDGSFGREVAFESTREFIRDVTMSYLEGLHKRRKAIESIPPAQVSEDGLTGVYVGTDGKTAVMTRASTSDAWGPPIQVS